MSPATDVLVIAASSGENLKLAHRFGEAARQKGLSAEVLDLTSLELPLYNPRVHAANGVPESVPALSRRMAAVSRWVICAPEYNGSIPPVLTSAIAWLSVEGDEFRLLFNGRPIAIASHSGGGGVEVLAARRINRAHLGAQVVVRQLVATRARPAADDSIDDIVARLAQLQPLQL
ncbi:MAG: NADPH-dependent FMN reductase [Cyanobacteriota bacterium]